MARLISTIHNVAFVLTMSFALISLKSAAGVMNTKVNSIFHLALFGIVTALLTLVFAPIPVVIRGREVGLTSLGFLLILWFLFGSDAAYVKYKVFPKGCGSYNKRLQPHCGELGAIMILCLLTWIMLSAYCCTFLIGTMRKGGGVSTSSSRSMDSSRAAPNQDARVSGSSRVGTRAGQTTTLRR